MKLKQIKLYDLFRKELNVSDEKAFAFVDTIMEIAQERFYEIKNPFSTKDDIHKLELKIKESKVEIYKAMFLTSIVQLMAILGGVLAIIKFIG